MKKIIRKVGNSIGITFNSEQQKVFSLTIGQVIQFEPQIVGGTASL